MATPLSVVLSGDELKVVGRIWEGAFYECRNGDIVGPIIDDGREISFGYAAALGGRDQETWYGEGWNADGDRGRDLVREVGPPLTWTGKTWKCA